MRPIAKMLLSQFFKSSQYIRRRFSFVSMFTLLRKLETLPDFPNSKCSDSQFLELTISGNISTYADLGELLSVPKLEVIDVGEFYSSKEPEYTIQESIFGETFKRHGSDKSSVHDYHRVYCRIFQKLGLDAPNILEIGLGSNNAGVPSNMGRKGKPGASLRAWRELFPSSNVVGADIDSSILFQEQNITTYELDQTSRKSWESFSHKIGSMRFNLIVDDGLHSPTANLKTLLYGINLLQEDGYLVVEDIHPRSVPIWSLALSGLKHEEEYWFLRTARALCLVVKPQNK